MSIFSGAKNKNELILVFNIGSSGVGGALFLAQESGIPKIIFTVEEPIFLKEQINIDRFLSLTTQSLEIVVNKIFMAGLGVPAKIFCVLSSPWYVSEARIINLQKNTPFVFTAKLADSLIQKEMNLFKEEYLAKNNNVDNAFRTIEFKNIKTMLNGYDTSKPLNQKTKELEMTVFISISGEHILQKIEDTIGKCFQFKQIKFSSFTMASFTTVRDIYTKQDNFLLVDIGGEVTDISMIKKNILRESISFPLGRNFMIRGVATNLNCSFNEAQSFLSLLKDGHAVEFTAKKIEPIITKLNIEWLKKFQDSLANISNDISIPATIYLSTEKDMVDLFCQIIKNEQFNQYTLTESKFEIIFLDTKIFHDFAIFEENVIRNNFIIIDSIFINRFLI